MRPSRQLRPSAPVPLEDRVVPSHGGAAGLQQPALVSASTFNADVDGTLHAGIPVHLRITTTYPDGTSEVTDRLIVPNGSNTQIIINHKALSGYDGGTETDEGIKTSDGNTITTHWIIHEPDGLIETQTITDVMTGHRTEISEILNEPDGNVQTVSGTSVEAGPVTILKKKFMVTNGKTHREIEITIDHGGIQKDDTLDIWPHSSMSGESQKTTSIEVRLPLPTS